MLTIMISYLKLHKYVIVATLSLSLFLLVTIGVNALYITASIVLLYRLFMQLLAKRFFSSKVTVALITIVLYVAILQSVIMCSWLVSYNFPLSLTPLATLIVIIISVGFRAFLRRKKPQVTVHRGSTSFSDVLSLSVSVVITALVLIGPIRAAVQENSLNVPSVLPDYMNTSIDDSNHFSRINDRIQYDRGVIYRSDAQQKVALGDTISSYPPAWQSANSVLMTSFYPEIQVGQESMFAYILSKLFWLFLLVFFFCMAVLTYCFGLEKKSLVKNKLNTWLVGSFLFFSLYTLIEQFREGFYSFMPLLISLVIIPTLLLQLREDTKKRDPSYRSMLPLVLLVANIALSWFLILPALLLTLAVVFFVPPRSGFFWASIKNFGKELASFSPILLVVFLSVLIQVLLLLAPSSRTFSEGVNDPGAITLHSIGYYVFIISGAIFGLLLTNARKTLGHFVVLLAPLLSFTLFIYIFQILTIGKPEYYYYKTLNTAVITALPFAIYGWTLVLRSLLDNTGKVNSIALSSAAVFLLPLTIGIEPLNTSNLSYLKGVRALTSSENEFISKSLASREKNKVIGDGWQDIVFYIPNDVGHNVIATNMARTTNRIDSCDNVAFSSILQDNLELLITTLGNCPEYEKPTIVTRHEHYDTIKDIVQQQGFEGKIELVSVN